MSRNRSLSGSFTVSPTTETRITWLVTPSTNVTVDPASE